MPFCFPRGPHAETIIPTLTRRRIRLSYERFRLELKDGDFVDLDFASSRCKEKVDTVVLALHGLEGDSRAPYLQSFGRSVLGRGYSFAAMNLRGCSGETNRLPRFYHSGETEDLQEVVVHLKTRFRRVFLVGFSLGGNVVLKAAGEYAEAFEGFVRGVSAFSVPLDLKGAALRIGGSAGGFYMKRFLKTLTRKIEAKAKIFPADFDLDGLKNLKDFREFDGRFTAPLNGFRDEEDYWARSSALQFLSNVKVPTLLVSARNDPFLVESCFPEQLARDHDCLHACFPERGGHVGFPSVRCDGETWHERLALDFLEKNCV